jgi:NAD+ synthase (glutamine-hydrolysing)
MDRAIHLAVVQLKPRKGDYAANVARLAGIFSQIDALEPRPDVAVFAETALTGYFVEGGVRDVAMSAGALARDLQAQYTAALGTPRPLDVCIGFYEEWNNAFYNSALYVTLGADAPVIRHVHRKLFLPTYGLFDERRFFAAGDLLRATPSQLGVGVGIAICEDFWHLTVPQLLALDGAQVLINVSSSPGRDLAATNEVGLGTATSWRTLMRTYAQLTTSIVIFCNRVGVDESISFWGGSEVIAPNGQALFSAPLFEEGLFIVEVPLADLRRERLTLPLLRDERPELQVRELTRIVAERAGLASDSTADDLAQAGLDVAPGDPEHIPIGFRPKVVP